MAGLVAEGRSAAGASQILLVVPLLIPTHCLHAAPTTLFATCVVTAGSLPTTRFLPSIAGGTGQRFDHAEHCARSRVRAVTMALYLPHPENAPHIAHPSRRRCRGLDPDLAQSPWLCAPSEGAVFDVGPRGAGKRLIDAVFKQRNDSAATTCGPWPERKFLRSRHQFGQSWRCRTASSSAKTRAVAASSPTAPTMCAASDLLNAEYPNRQAI